MSKHALLSASGAKRWMACTPSARLEERFDEVRSVYADEGTFAHQYAENILKRATDMITQKQFSDRRGRLRKNEFYSQSLEDYIETYTSIVLERRTKDAIVMLESKLDYSRWVEDGFGTGDVIIINDGLLEIIDLKYGAGIPVSAIDNPQLRLYALGALDAFECLYDVQVVRMTIIQPRLDIISSEDMSIKELHEWAENEVVPKAKLAFEGKGDFAAGDHCRWCKIKATCRHRADDNLQLAQFDFKTCELLDDNEIGEILRKAEQLQVWAKDVWGYAFEQALKGKKWDGWKLVEGRSTRKYTDENAIVEVLTTEGFKDDDIFSKKLQGIMAMEKLLGKKRFEDMLSNYVHKPKGSPSLVPSDDKRPEINSSESAVADFAEDDDFLT